jgi:hypothetical protein
MMTLKIAEFLNWFIISTIAYLFVTIFSGYLQALISKKLGDPSAEYAGFLSFNPLIYIDWLGYALFLMTGFGWGAMVPIDPYHFTGRYKRLELIFAYASRPIVHGTLILLMLMLMVACFGGLFGQEIPILQFFLNHPELTIVIRRLIIAIVGFALAFMVYSILIGFVRLLLFYSLKEVTVSWQQLEIVSLIMAFLMIYFLANPVTMILLRVLLAIEFFLWQWWQSLATLLGFISFYS